MNWNNIKEKYPKAYKQFEDWWFVKNAIVNIDSTYFRHLYDFFDGRGIYGSVYHRLSGGFKYDIQDDDNFLLVDGDTPDALPAFKIRTEAEEKAFEKAFEILEVKLK